MMNVTFLDLLRVNQRYQLQIEAAVLRVARSGRYLTGAETDAFERDFAQYIGTRHCVSCANGLDALTLIFRALIALGRLQEGDKVMVPANTFIASILAITECRLQPVLVEPDPDTLQISETEILKSITPQCKALMLVHLYGRCAFSSKIAEIVREHNLLLIEDNAQAHGCCFCDDKGMHRTGSLSLAAGHSFYPTKTLGALGDAGAVTTDDQLLAQTIRAMANYGSDRRYHNIFQGRNSRMDELQAAVLREKLLFLDSENSERQRMAQYYYDNLQPVSFSLPPKAPKHSNVYHLFPIILNEHVNRQQWREKLARKGVATDIHYPIPPHQQPCFAKRFSQLSLPVTERIHRSIVSLPLFPGLTDEELSFVAQQVNDLNT